MLTADWLKEFVVRGGSIILPADGEVE